jgi:hypothetical protein
MRITFILALATIVPLPFEIDQGRAADRLPAFNITQNCNTEAAGSGVGSVPSCVKDENDAKGQLVKSWSAYSASDKRVCVEESTIGGDQSYVELITCLEMASGADFGN